MINRKQIRQAAWILLATLTVLVFPNMTRLIS